MFSLYLHRVTGSCAANENVCRRRPEALFTTPEEQKHLKCRLLSRRAQAGKVAALLDVSAIKRGGENPPDHIPS